MEYTTDPNILKLVDTNKLIDLELPTIRCFTCGKTIGDKFFNYIQLIRSFSLIHKKLRTLKPIDNLDKYIEENQRKIKEEIENLKNKLSYKERILIDFYDDFSLKYTKYNSYELNKKMEEEIDLEDVDDKIRAIKNKIPLKERILIDIYEEKKRKNPKLSFDQVKISKEDIEEKIRNEGGNDFEIMYTNYGDLLTDITKKLKFDPVTRIKYIKGRDYSTLEELLEESEIVTEYKNNEYNEEKDEILKERKENLTDLTRFQNLYDELRNDMLKYKDEVIKSLLKDLLKYELKNDNPNMDETERLRLKWKKWKNVAKDYKTKIDTKNRRKDLERNALISLRQEDLDKNNLEYTRENIKSLKYTKKEIEDRIESTEINIINLISRQKGIKDKPRLRGKVDLSDVDIKEEVKDSIAKYFEEEIDFEKVEPILEKIINKQDLVILPDYKFNNYDWNRFLDSIDTEKMKNTTQYISYFGGIAGDILGIDRECCKMRIANAGVQRSESRLNAEQHSNIDQMSKEIFVMSRYQKEITDKAKRDIVNSVIKPIDITGKEEYSINYLSQNLNESIIYPDVEVKEEEEEKEDKKVNLTIIDSELIEEDGRQVLRLVKKEEEKPIRKKIKRIKPRGRIVNANSLKLLNK